MSNDFIRLPRSALSDELWHNPNLARLLVYLLAKVDDNGEIKTDMTAIAKDLVLSRQNVRTLMKIILANQILTKSSTTRVTKLKLWNQEDKPKRQSRSQPNRQPNRNQVTSLMTDYISPSFVADEYREAWQMWIEYRKEINNNYKSEKSEEIGYEQLIRKSGDNPEVAMQMIKNSIANGYKGLFAIKDNSNGKRNDYPANRVNPPRTPEQRATDYQELAEAVSRRVEARKDK